MGLCPPPLLLELPFADFMPKAVPTQQSEMHKQTNPTKNIRKILNTDIPFKDENRRTIRIKLLGLMTAF
jgi:hypothetical protein